MIRLAHVGPHLERLLPGIQAPFAAAPDDRRLAVAELVALVAEPVGDRPAGGVVPALVVKALRVEALTLGRVGTEDERRNVRRDALVDAIHDRLAVAGQLGR